MAWPPSGCGLLSLSGFKSSLQPSKALILTEKIEDVRMVVDVCGIGLAIDEVLLMEDVVVVGVVGFGGRCGYCWC